MEFWRIYLEDITIALLVLGLCGFSRWFYLFTAPLALVVIGVTCIFGSPLNLFFGNTQELLLMAVLVSFRHQGRIKNVCYPAIVSVGCAILNPSVVSFLFWVTRFPFWVVRGDSELRSFDIGLVAVIAGHIALWRIKRSEHLQRGRFLAWIGLTLGYLWIFGWLFLLLEFDWGMTHWH
jgi:hypothetical protein